jgi:hypothetical protein
VEKAPGYYDLRIVLKKGGLSAGLSEKVHIYAGLESAAVFTFVEADFVQSVYLAGTLTLPNGVTVSNGTISAYSDAEYTNLIGTDSVPQGNGSWAVGIPVSDAASVVYLKAVVTGSNGKAYAFTGNTSGATPEEGAQDIALTNPNPADVTGLTATAGNGQVTLTWNNPGDADLDHIEISRNGGTYNTTNATTVTRTITSLTNGTEYTFTVKAVDTAENKSAGVDVKAKPFRPVAVTGVNLTPATLSLKVSGVTGTLNATLLPIGATAQTVAWSSTNESVATVDEEGTVTAVAEGQATITVTVNGNYTKTCTVTVIVSLPALVKDTVEQPLVPGMAFIKQGGSETFTAVVLDNPS